MPFLTLQLNTKIPTPIGASKGRPALRKVADVVEKALAGTGTVDSWVLLNDNTPQSGTTVAGMQSRACAGVVLSSATGTVTHTINGTACSASAGGSDTITAGLVSDAINANTTVNPFVASTKYLATVALASVTAGQTIDICGTTFTATAAATGKPFEFDISGNDAADATALLASIMRSPLAAKLVGSLNSATIYLGLAENRAARSDEVIAGPSTFTISQFATRAAWLTFARQAGPLGNCCTATASAGGGTATAFSGVAGKLGGGTGGYLSTSQYLTSDTK